MPLVEQELLTLPEHMSSPSVFSGVLVTRPLVVCVCFVDCCLSFCIFSFWCCLFFLDIRILIALWYLQTLLTPPPFFNFLFTYLFSIKFLYFFIISSLPYFSLFVSIFIQSYANSNLRVWTLYIISTCTIGNDTHAFDTEG